MSDMKKTFLIVIGCLVLGFVAMYFFVYQSQVPGERIDEKHVAQYSVEAKILAVSSSGLGVKVGRIEDTEKGSGFVSYEKVFTLAPYLLFVEGGKSVGIQSSSILKYVRLGDFVILYGADGRSPWGNEGFSINKIEIVSRGTAPSPLPVLR